MKFYLQCRNGGSDQWNTIATVEASAGIEGVAEALDKLASLKERWDASGVLPAGQSWRLGQRGPDGIVQATPMSLGATLGVRVGDTPKATTRPS